MIGSSNAARRLIGKTRKLKRLRAHICANRNRRESIYQREWERYGFVPCYVCRQHVKKAEATLEHILPRSLGGSDAGSNLAISHPKCNSTRGNKILAHRADANVETVIDITTGRAWR